MKTILFLTDTFFHGGLETHLYTYFKRLKETGIKIIFASNFVEQPYFCGIDLIADEIINFNFSPKEFSISNIFKILDPVIKSRKIDLIHAHPFLTIFGGFLLACTNNLPFVVTLHGKASLFAPDNASNIFLEEIIFKHSSAIIMVNKALYRTFLSTYNNVRFLPNPIDEDIFYPKTETQRNGYVLIVSRLDRDKLSGLEKALDLVLPVLYHRKITVKLAGSGQFEQKIRDKYSHFISKGTLQLLGVVNPYDLAHLMRRSKAVLGMGRVILEAIFTNTPTVLTGYEGIIGWMNTQLFKKASLNNFNGSGLPILSRKEVSRLLEMLVMDEKTKSEAHQVGRIARKIYS